MNGKLIDNEIVKQLLSLANWAPNHGGTEPWRFIVFEGEAKKRFCLQHAELYKSHTAPDKFQAAKYDKLVHQSDKTSHTLIVYMKRTQGHTIPVLEEIAAVAAAIENILLGATAFGIAALWGSGGMTHHPAMKEYFGLGNEDVIMGMLHLGYTDLPEQSRHRKTSAEEKTNWQAE